MVQCSVAESHSALMLADRPSTGVVLTGPRVKQREVRAFADVAGRAGRPLLVDAAGYAGAARKLGSARFDPAWLRLQRDTGLPVLSDSGYIGEGDEPALRSVLGQARAAGDVIATLPLHAGWWLDPARGLPNLLDRVHDAGVPVALVLEHRDDPYGVRRTLRGVLALLQIGVPVLQLRCDVSGLGLLCHGAHAAAIGTSTSRRHLYPRSTSGGGGRPASVATLVRDCLSFVTVERIAFAVAADPDNSLWTACVCPSCKGRTLDTIAQAPEHERASRAFGHAVHVLFELRDDLIGRATGPAARQVSWREHCSSAVVRYSELHDSGQEWRRPAFLTQWLAVPAPSHTT